MYQCPLWVTKADNVGILVSFSIAEINTMTKSSVGAERFYLTYTST